MKLFNIDSKKEISLELIQYQIKDSFIDKAEYLIEKIREEIKNNIYPNNSTLLVKSSYIKDLENLIKSRFNMNIVFDNVLHNVSPFAIIPYFGDYLREYNGLKQLGSNVLSALFKFDGILKHLKTIETERKKILENISNKNGYIDFKNARVGGYLSEVKHYLIFDFYYGIRVLNLSNRELVAIMLHEIGHAFTGLEYHHKLEKVNSVIADIINEINKNNVDKALFIFKTNFKYEEFKNIIINSKKDIYDFYGKIAIGYIREINTQMINSKYDETNFELLADSFAGRFGLYKELVSGLHKIYTINGTLFSKSISIFGLLFFIDLILNILTFVLYGPLGIIMSAFLILTIYNKNNKYNVMTYDLPLDRYERIKNNLINNMKNLELPENVQKELYEQYLFITETIEKSLYYKPIMQKIADTILLGNKEIDYYIKLQQSIEKGLNNILFVDAVKLKTI